jgi:hypothetical protein
VGEAGATFVLEGSDLDYGVARIVVVGDETNAGKISATININTEYEWKWKPNYKGKVAEGSSDAYYFNVPTGASTFNIKLAWDDNWGKYPTDDLDLAVYDPDGNFMLLDNDFDGDIDGLSLDSPERLSIANPMAGEWTMFVDGYTVWKGKEKYDLFTEVETEVALAKNGERGAVEFASAVLPESYRLAQNYPNPFNPSTNINFDLPEPAPVSLQIYNSIGQLVSTLINEQRPAGYHSVVWNGSDDSGHLLPSGVYFYRINAGNFVESRKMMLVK